MKPEAGWRLLLKSVIGIIITFVASVLVLGVFVRLIDGGGSWWFTGHSLREGGWYEAVRNTVATVALSVAGGAAYLAYRRQRTADLMYQTAADTKEISAQAQVTAAKAQMIAAETLELSNKQHDLALRRREEDAIRELRARFSAAAEHLAHPSAAVRISGVYAMTALAHDWESVGGHSGEVQVCINVLCGYLRLPYDPKSGTDNRSKLILKKVGVDGDSNITHEEHFEFRNNDKEVRQTIVRMIASHLKRGAKNSWSSYTFDFQGAALEDTDFVDAYFKGGVDFTGTQFHGMTRFWRAQMLSFTDFSKAHFHSSADFDEAVFDTAYFSESKFSGPADFNDTVFHSATFSYSQFHGSATFKGATFKSDSGYFLGAKFHRDALFQDVKFPDALADFQYSEFNSTADFKNVSFERGADFSNATFGASEISFDDPRAWGPPVPIFPWSNDVTSKPHNVLPEAWPPSPSGS